jgi:hypothetical protein
MDVHDLGHRDDHHGARLSGSSRGDSRCLWASFRYQAGSWTKPRRVVATVEWHRGELYPRVGFIVTNLARSVERLGAFYNHRGTCEQYIKEGKGYQVTLA